MEEKSTFEGKGVKGVANYYLTHTKAQKGITLIALIITIIVLLILSAVTLNLSMNTGIIDTSKDAKIEYRKSEYKDEVSLIILEAKVEIHSGNTDTLLKIIEDKIKEKDWYLSSQVYQEDQMLASSKLIASTENINVQPNTEEPKTILSNIELIVITKDNYEIGIAIEEDKAELEYVIYGTAQTYTITYNANDGTGNVITQEVRQGKKAMLKENPFTRANYSFVGWVDDINSETAYQENAQYPENGIQSDITLYAKWSRDTVKLTLFKNDGTETKEETNVEKNGETILASNVFSRSDYNLLGWSTDPDATTATYEDGGTVYIAQSDLPLYAVWGKKYYVWNRYLYTPNYKYQVKGLQNYAPDICVSGTITLWNAPTRNSSERMGGRG